MPTVGGGLDDARLATAGIVSAPSGFEGPGQLAGRVEVVRGPDDASSNIRFRERGQHWRRPPLAVHRRCVLNFRNLPRRKHAFVA